MRWKHSPPPPTYSYRIVNKFLLLPVTLGWETRWLERADILQCYRDGWEDDRWATEEDRSWVEEYDREK